MYICIYKKNKNKNEIKIQQKIKTIFFLYFLQFNKLIIQQILINSILQPIHQIQHLLRHSDK